MTQKETDDVVSDHTTLSSFYHQILSPTPTPWPSSSSPSSSPPTPPATIIFLVCAVQVFFGRGVDIDQMEVVRDFQINILFLYNVNDHKVLIEFITYFWRVHTNCKGTSSRKIDGQVVFEDFEKIQHIVIPCAHCTGINWVGKYFCVITFGRTFWLITFFFCRRNRIKMKTFTFAQRNEWCLLKSQKCLNCKKLFYVLFFLRDKKEPFLTKLIVEIGKTEKSNWYQTQTSVRNMRA